MAGRYLLTDRRCKVETKTGLHADGAGLYLTVKAGRKGWTFISQRGGGRSEYGLGGYPSVSLAEARSKADQVRAAIRAGEDPKTLLRPAANNPIPAFGGFALEHVKAVSQNFSNAKHRQQWVNTLTQYCRPLWRLPLDKVETDHVLKCLSPIWHSKPETASRLRGRIEAVLAAATAKKLRQGPNPAAWKDNLEPLLGKRARLTRGHHKAMPYDDLPAFLKQLRAIQASSARCLEFTILTAARTGEAIGARWNEFDIDGKVWSIPPERMKTKTPHRVPLSEGALAILAPLAAQKTGPFVFFGRRVDQPMSNMSMAMQLKRMGFDVTVHGFRSTFRDWVEEQTSTPHSVAEAALAHKISNKVEAAYRRSDLFEARRKLMEHWSQFCASALHSNVVSLEVFR